jgi:hypothetical protein
VAGENVGDYTISQGSLANSNYSISYSGGNLAINPAYVVLDGIINTILIADSVSGISESTVIGAVTAADIVVNKEDNEPMPVCR